MNDSPEMREVMKRLQFNADFQRGYGNDMFFMRRSDADAILAAFATQSPEQQGEGMVLVPREITDDMRAAIAGYSTIDTAFLWKTLLASAPPIPDVQDGGELQPHPSDYIQGWYQRATPPAIPERGEVAIPLVFYDSGDRARRLSALADAYANSDGKVSVVGKDRLVSDLRDLATPRPAASRPDVVELVAEWKRLEDAFHDAVPDQGDPGDGGVAGRALCQFIYDNSDALRAALCPDTTAVSGQKMGAGKPEPAGGEP